MITLALFLILICGLYLYGTRNYKYWELKGVKHDQPLPFFGNIVRINFLQASTPDVIRELYYKYSSESVVGFYRMSLPELLIKDPEMIKQILIANSNCFHMRGLLTEKKTLEPLFRNIIYADGDIWRLLRQRLTPAFTGGKLKAMFPLIIKLSEKLQARVLSATTAGTEIDAHDLMMRYTVDLIGACGLGLQFDSLQKENSPFINLAHNMLKFGPKEVLIFTLKEIFPTVFRNLKLHSQMEKEILNLVIEIQKQRNYEPSRRNDFIDLLLEYKKKGTMVGESIERKNPEGMPEIATLEMDDELMASQVYMFFVAGSETSSTASSITLHELAYHPEVQSKVHKEIDRVLAKYDNKLSYDAIKEMTYLNWTFKEAMRIFPPVPFIYRECTQKYTFEKINLTIDKGVRVLVALPTIHNDPKYFENPTEFKPERFDPANFDMNNKFVYLPFGDGPRSCIGARLGQMQSLVGLVAILARFIVRPGPSSVRHPKVRPPSRITQNIKGLPLIFIERNK
ncbi:unnamed protein product [Euphydryas editha]|uniref:unspecific monooxygenase n=1 Tax=Euphydryas editha TaxID=104508 RepID=A0AAU9V6Y4_EUPED|nr:unnamed protein product [Euphydryas editha]